jgi:hypothetical protein
VKITLLPPVCCVSVTPYDYSPFAARELTELICQVLVDLDVFVLRDSITEETI